MNRLLGLKRVASRGLVGEKAYLVSKGTGRRDRQGASGFVFDEVTGSGFILVSGTAKQ